MPHLLCHQQLNHAGGCCSPCRRGGKGLLLTVSSACAALYSKEREGGRGSESCGFTAPNSGRGGSATTGPQLSVGELPNQASWLGSKVMV